jgi:hypothetical protein
VRDIQRIRLESSLSYLDLMMLHVNTLFTHDAAGRIVADNEPDGEPAPRFFLGRTREGNTWRVRYDVPDRIARELAAIVAAEPVRDDLGTATVQLDAILDVLRPGGEPAIGHHGPAYRFPDAIPGLEGTTRITRANLHLLHRMIPNLATLERDFDHVEPWMAMVVDGAAVAACFSVRLTDRAAEARVDTLPEYRGRGYAPVVVAAWARAVRETGRIPFYGTSWDNAASQAVARKLGLVQYAVVLALA